MTRFERLVILCTVAIVGTISICTWCIVTKLSSVESYVVGIEVFLESTVQNR